MGTWGIKNFENDTAADWLNRFQEEKSTKEVEAILDQILEEPDFIDDEESFITLGFLELLAVTQKLMHPTIDINVSFNVTHNLIYKTIKAVHKILFFEKHSELRALWEEPEEYNEWQDYQLFLIRNLKDYLGTIAPNVKSDDSLPALSKDNSWLPPDWQKN